MAPFTVGPNVCGSLVGLVDVGRAEGEIVGLLMTMPEVGFLVAGANVGAALGVEVAVKL